jgi:hypothetical protein
MQTLPDPHNVREFVKSLAPGTRVIWIANGTRGVVQPDKAILWDDGSRMDYQRMNDCHALLIHSEAEWRRMNESLTTRLHCLRCGCTIERWDEPARKANRPEKLCPIAVLSDPYTVPRPPGSRRLADSVRLAPPKFRPQARA